MTKTLLDKNPSLSRQDLDPQIHAIGDDTHPEIEALLTERRATGQSRAEGMVGEKQAGGPVLLTR